MKSFLPTMQRLGILLRPKYHYISLAIIAALLLTGSTYTYVNTRHHLTATTASSKKGTDTSDKQTANNDASNTQSPQATHGQSAGTPASRPDAAGQTTKAAGTANGSPSANTLPNATASKKTLIFSKSSISFGAGEKYAFVEVSSGSSVKLGMPTVTTTDGILSYVSPPSSNDDRLKPTWSVQLSRLSPSENGQGYVSLSAFGNDGMTYTGKILVSRPPVPYFYVKQGLLTRTYEGDSVTLTANFTLQPGPNFGAPTIRMSMSTDQGCMLVPTTVLSRTITYSGQNDYSLSCTLYQSVYNNGGFWINVNLAGDYVGGGASLSYLSTQ